MAELADAADSNPPRATSWGFDPPSRHQDKLHKVNRLQRPKPLSPRGFFHAPKCLMPRKRKPVRGLWEREPGSEIWWNRYRVDGVRETEKVGTHEAGKQLR